VLDKVATLSHHPNQADDREGRPFLSNVLEGFTSIAIVIVTATFLISVTD
jgi:hypothetical protein